VGIGGVEGRWRGAVVMVKSMQGGGAYDMSKGGARIVSVWSRYITTMISLLWGDP
jgi:hypothetical protein